jgi:hypothetical protein
MTPSTEAQPTIACSLSAAHYRTRVADMRGLAERALIGRTDIDGGEKLTFAAGPGVEQALRRFVAGESDCCPFLALHLDAQGDELVLTVLGPQDAQPIIKELFA